MWSEDVKAAVHFLPGRPAPRAKATSNAENEADGTGSAAASGAELWAESGVAAALGGKDLRGETAREAAMLSAFPAFLVYPPSPWQQRSSSNGQIITRSLTSRRGNNLLFLLVISSVDLSRLGVATT